MTARALAGLLGLGIGFTAVGMAVLWAACPGLTRAGLARLSGLAYLLGVAALGVVWSQLVVVGVPFGWATAVASVVAVAATCVLVGRRLGRRAPARGAAFALAPSALLGAASIALLGVLAEALFRAARLQPLTAFDAWAFWVPKAKVIYFFGGLDEQAFTTLPNPNYPPLLPTVDAVAFHAMGGTDVVTLHVLHWSYAVAFAWACAGLLAPRVRGWILWPCLGLLVTTPRLFSRLLVPEADLLLDFMIGLAAVLIGIWLVERRGEALVLAGLLLAAGVCTKRDGTAFAGTLLLAAAIASRGRLSAALPRLAAVAAFVVLVGIPWRVWYLSHDIQGETPPVKGVDLDRAWASLRLSFETLSDSALWGTTVAVGIAAIGLALVFGSRRLGLYAALVVAGLFACGALSTYSFRELEISTNPGANPIIRLTIAAVVASGVLAPVLLSSVWRRHEGPNGARP